MTYRTLLFMLSFLSWSIGLSAQSGQTDFMRNMGKMYVVIAVVLAIFIGIVLFLIYLDRKLTRLEKQIKDHG